MAIDVSTIHISFCDKIALTHIRIRKRVRIIDIDSHKHYKVLVKKSLIENILTKNGRPRHTQYYRVHSIGYEYINYHSEHRFDSVLCPIIVTILTNIVINVLQWLSQQL